MILSRSWCYFAFVSKCNDKQLHVNFASTKIFFLLRSKTENIFDVWFDKNAFLIASGNG